jgi:hypothetical protein
VTSADGELVKDEETMLFFQPDFGFLSFQVALNVLATSITGAREAKEAAAYCLVLENTVLLAMEMEDRGIGLLIRASFRAVDVAADMMNASKNKEIDCGALVNE